jgi:sugar (pentulose or hexulose) kinase
MEVVIGVDLGTQGARVFAVQPDGMVAAQASAQLQLASQSLPAGWIEQDAEAWWLAVCACLRQVTASLPAGVRVAGISVDSTSGTIVPVDGQGQPLCAALMYNDQRSEGQVVAVQRAGAELQTRLGYAFGSSFGLPKITWFQQARPQIFAQARWFLHAADFIAGRLSGEMGVSDSSNALKTGYDLLALAWPAFIESELGIPLERLPRVVLPGQALGAVCAQASQQTGLCAGVAIYAGATDGTAAQFASGAAQPGDWNSTLGTTLVLKGIARELHPDPRGVIYSHRHPEGFWLPGGASNTGSDWVSRDHAGQAIEELDRQAEGVFPSALVRYPLAKQGERFPFLHAGAQGFTLGPAHTAIEGYAAGIEGMALVERLSYAVLQSLGLEVGERVYITGGGTRSPLWTRIRASVLGKTLVQPEVTETAFGTALLAAAGCWYGNLSQASAAMVKIRQSVEPEAGLQARYDEKYQAFLAGLCQRGYIQSDV